jgi:hypothetical protein
MVWVRRMDEGPNPGKNKEPEARLGRFSPPGWKKKAVGDLVGLMDGDALTNTACFILFRLILTRFIIDRHAMLITIFPITLALAQKLSKQYYSSRFKSLYIDLQLFLLCHI